MLFAIRSSNSFVKAGVVTGAEFPEAEAQFPEGRAEFPDESREFPDASLVLLLATAS